MTKLTPINNRAPAALDAPPLRNAEAFLEGVARELMTVSAMLRSAELRDQVCQAETVRHANNALQDATADVRKALRRACEPATVASICESIEALIQSIPQGEVADGYCAALTVDVGSLHPSRGGLEAACRRLRTTAMYRPKIPEVLTAVREGTALYEASLRALDQLPGQIARAEHARLHAERRRTG
jgi:hypothetical protein